MDLWVPGSELDRIDDRRRGEGWLESLWSDPGARLIRVDEESNLFADAGSLRLARPAGAFDADAHYLVGLVGGAPVFAAAADPDGSTASLRQLAPALRDTERDLATTAIALVNWHRVAPYCGACGSLTQVREGGIVRYCASCDRERFPRTDPAIIVAVLDAEGRLLLGHQLAWDHNRVSLLAGFVSAGESLEQAVHREVLEESAVRLGAVRYVGSQPWPFPRSLMLGFVADAVTTDVTVDGKEIEWAKFFSVDEIERLVADGSVSLPGQSSIASRIIAQWRAGQLAVSRT